jgi:hypothetical protein
VHVLGSSDQIGPRPTAIDAWPQRCVSRYAERASTRTRPPQSHTICTTPSPASISAHISCTAPARAVSTMASRKDMRRADLSTWARRHVLATPIHPARRAELGHVLTRCCSRALCRTGQGQVGWRHGGYVEPAPPVSTLDAHTGPRHSGQHAAHGCCKCRFCIPRSTDG